MKICVMGLGSIGMRHVRNLLEMGETDVLGYDIRIGEPGFSCEPIQGTNSLDLVLQWKPDVVLVCTPPESHFDLCRHALSNDAHVFCEKPLAVDVKESEWLCLYARTRKRQLAVGYQLRWQILGIHRNSNLTWEVSQDMRQWPSRYEKDVLLEFSHEIEAACFVNGPVRMVWAEEDQWGWTINLHHFFCTSTILINPLSQSVSRACYLNNSELWRFDQAKNDQAYKDELTAFLAACQGEPMDSRLCTGTHAVHVLKIIEACKRSAEEYGIVKL